MRLVKRYANTTRYLRHCFDSETSLMTFDMQPYSCEGQTDSTRLPAPLLALGAVGVRARFESLLDLCLSPQSADISGKGDSRCLHVQQGQASALRPCTGPAGVIATVLPQGQAAVDCSCEGVDERALRRRQRHTLHGRWHKLEHGYSWKPAGLSAALHCWQRHALHGKAEGVAVCAGSLSLSLCLSLPPTFSSCLPKCSCERIAKQQQQCALCNTLAACECFTPELGS